MLLRFLNFNARAEYVLGKNLAMADALSRNPVPSVGEPDESLDIEVYV